MTYRNIGGAAARIRTKAEIATDLKASLEMIARRLLFSSVGASEEQRDLLHDVARGRYPMKTLAEMIAIARSSVKPEDREALAEMIRGLLLDGVPAISDPRIAGDLEMRAQVEHDFAWRAFEFTQTRTTRDRALETGTLHQYGLRAQLDVLHAFRCL
jgi:hypothetical protein